MSLWNGLNDPEQLAKAQIGLSWLLWRDGKKEEAKSKIQEAIAILEERAKFREKALLLRDLGEFFAKSGESSLAWEYLSNSFEIFKAQGNAYESEKTKKILDGVA